MAPPPGPTYDLDSLKAEVKARRYRVTRVAVEGASALKLDDSDIEACVLALDEGDFYKTMKSETRTGLMQDVYKPTYLGITLYVKVQHDGIPWVISFKKDESR